MRRIAFTAGLAAAMLAGPAMAQQYIAFTTIDKGESASVTFVNTAFYGGDLTYNISGNGLLRVQEPRVPMKVRVRYADGRSYEVDTTLNPANAVRSSSDPSVRYWCLFVGRQRFAVNTDALCARYAEGDATVKPN